MNVESLFEVCYQKYPGASEPELTRFTVDWRKPLTQEEIAEITGRQRNPFPVNDPLHAIYRPFDPALWTLPDMPLPAAYLNFLRYSNGGEFGNLGYEDAAWIAGSFEELCRGTVSAEDVLYNS